MTKHRIIINRLLALLLFAGLVLLDQLTKSLAVRDLSQGPDTILIPGVLSLTYVENHGVAFGFFSRITWLPTAFSIILMLYVTVMYLRLSRIGQFRAFRILFVIIGAGGVGNLVDRIRLGYVIDFIYVELIQFPVFNVADMLITLSAFTAVILLFTLYRDQDMEALQPVWHPGQKQREDV